MLFKYIMILFGNYGRYLNTADPVAINFVNWNSM